MTRVLGCCGCFGAGALSAAVRCARPRAAVAGRRRGDARRPRAVQALLKQGADVNAAQGDGMTALHWAAERGDAELVTDAALRRRERQGGDPHRRLHAAAPRQRRTATRAVIDALLKAAPRPTRSPRPARRRCMLRGRGWQRRRRHGAARRTAPTSNAKEPAVGPDAADVRRRGRPRPRRSKRLADRAAAPTVNGADRRSSTSAQRNREELSRAAGPATPGLPPSRSSAPPNAHAAGLQPIGGAQPRGTCRRRSTRATSPSRCGYTELVGATGRPHAAALRGTRQGYIRRRRARCSTPAPTSTR